MYSMFCRNKAIQNTILVQDGWKNDTERYKMLKGTVCRIWERNIKK